MFTNYFNSSMQKTSSVEWHDIHAQLVSTFQTIIKPCFIEESLWLLAAKEENLRAQEQFVPLQRLLISINILFNNKNKHVLKGWKLCIVFTKHLEMFIKKNSGISGVNWSQASSVIFLVWPTLYFAWLTHYNSQSLLRTIWITFKARNKYLW